jgi:TonB family protein
MYADRHGFGLDPSCGAGFKWMVVISIFLHLAALSTALVLTTDTRKKTFYAPVNIVEIVEPRRKEPKRHKPSANSVRIKKTVKKTTPTVKTKKSRKKAAISVTKEDVTSVNVALTKIKKNVKEREENALVEDRIESMKKALAEETERSNRLEKLRSKIKNMEAELSKGIMLEGSLPFASQGQATREHFELEFKAYYMTLQRYIESNWIYTAHIKEGEFVILSIKVDKSGNIVERWLEESSANEALNMSAIKAIDKVTAGIGLPPLPDGMGTDPVEIGFRFCPAGCAN